MRREPLLLPALAFATGIGFAHLFPIQPFVLAVCAVGCGLALLLSIWLRRLRPASVVASFLVAGLAVQMVHRPQKHPHLDIADGDTALLDGCVTNPPVFSPGREQFTLELAPHAAIRLSVVMKDGQPASLSYGQKVEAAAKVRSPRNFGNPDAFDYEGYLANQHIYWIGSVAGVGDLKLLPGTCGSPVLASLYTLRTWALNRISTLYTGDQHTLGLLQATLLGETAGVERRWTSEFRVTGTYHAIVISGLHVWILAESILLLLRLLQLRRLPALAIAAAACWIYAFVSGFNAPVIRAAAGFTLFLIASYFFRRTRILNVLGAVGLIFLACAPEELFDPSFQLSFLSAFAIAAFAIPLMENTTRILSAAVKRFDQIRYDPMVDPRAAPWRVELRLLARCLQVWSPLSEQRSQFVVAIVTKAFAMIADIILVSACVQFALALPMIAYFHRLSLTGLSANLIVVPLLSITIVTGFATLLTGWPWLTALTAHLLHWSEATATWHLQFEPPWRMSAVPLAWALAFSCVLIGLGLAVRFGRRSLLLPLLVSSAILFTVICWQPWQPLLSPRMLEVTAIDVGQGDSLFIAFPNGQTMLVDAGGVPGMERMKRKPNMDLGEDVVSPYLWSRRLHRLDFAALTHGHSDHMAGLPAILDNFRPAVLWTGAEPSSKEWKEVESHAAVDRVRIEQLHRGVPDWVIGGARIHVLAPSPDYVPAETAKNDDSLVLQISYGKRSVILTGDAERPVEDDLVNAAALQPVTLLKVGHHGSRTSSSEEFLAAVAPQYAFISDGYQNQFHHPHPVVLQRLADHHVAVYRTDQHGLLTFRTDGDRVEITSFH